MATNASGSKLRPATSNSNFSRTSARDGSQFSRPHRLGLMTRRLLSGSFPGLLFRAVTSRLARPHPLRSPCVQRKTIPDEPNSIPHDRGVLSMARTDEPHSASTHFFILVSVASDLDGKFAAFGRVTKGMEVRRCDQQGTSYKRASGKTCTD